MVLLSQYNIFWFPAFQSQNRPSKNSLFLTAILFAATFYTDYINLSAASTLAALIRGYGAILAYLILSSRRNTVLNGYLSTNPARHHSLGLLIGAALSIPAGLYGYLTTVGSASTELASTLLPLLLLSSLTLLLLDPFVDRTVGNAVSRTKHVKNGFTCVGLCAWFVALVAFGHRWRWSDVGLIWLARFCRFPEKAFSLIR